MKKALLSLLLTSTQIFLYAKIEQKKSEQNVTNVHMSTFVRPKNRAAIVKSFEHKDITEVFSEIYKTNFWCGSKSRSGHGSSLTTTEIVRKELSDLCKSLEIKTVLDIGCGDFYWMRTVDLHGADYIGADIVPEMIEKNCETYADAKHAFVCLNSANESLPTADLVICRDVLMHLNFQTACDVLRNIKASGSKYALITTHLQTTQNNNIMCGSHHPYKLTLPPFNLPEPRLLIEETCAEKWTRSQRKSLGLWLIDEIDPERFEY